MTQTLTAPAAARKVPAFILIALVGAALLTLSAQFKVPFYPVPMTLQTLVVLALPLFFGWRGAASVGAYLAAGAAGLPVFAAGGGIGYFFGPTGGFLPGFLLAAGFVAMFMGGGGGKPLWRPLAVLLVADALLFLSGVIWLAQFVGFDAAVKGGFLQFALGDLLKVIVVATAYHLWRRRG
ncbi:MAG: biotin transporter BioY [Gammaproteobacteria bacterium]